MSPIPADVVDDADVRMREGGDRAGFALEASTAIRIGGELRGQHLESRRVRSSRVSRAL